jgi:hypothetical protein
MAALASLCTWKWSKTSWALGSPTSGSVSAERYGAAGSSAAIFTPDRQAGLWAANQSRRTLRERPSMMSSGRPRARSTITVTYRRRRPWRARFMTFSSTPIATHGRSWKV